MGSFGIYEAANDTRHEFYLATSLLPLENVVEANHSLPPPTIGHWRPDEENIEYRLIETDLDADEARQFLEEYAIVCRRTGWTVLTD